MLNSIVKRSAGLRNIFNICFGCIPSEKSTIISLSLDNLKSVRVAATKKLIGKV